jgi:5-methylcytosine-specific restriction endonuclease McrA
VTRPPIPVRMKIDSLLFRAVLLGHPILCNVCHAKLSPGDVIEWDHYNPLALGGAHTWANLLPLHKACHRKKTSGTKATSAGSDIHTIAKVKRLANGGKKRRGPKMKSRGFDKTMSRKMDGSVSFR